MEGSSRGAIRAARQALGRALASPGTDRWALGEELFAVAEAVGGSTGLRRALADPSRDGADKAALVTRLFTGRVGTAAKQVAEQTVAQRWAEEHDLLDALDSLAVESLLAQAEEQGRLGTVEDELFRFGRVVEGDDGLRAALSDRRAPAASKVELVDRLLADKVTAWTRRLARQAVSAPRGRRVTRVIDLQLQVAARRQEQLTATVTAAVPLDERQRERLTRALAELYGRAVQANVLVDPEVVGGIRVEIGDEVIDGTILSRLEDARRRLAG